jgi:hypothetical protein
VNVVHITIICELNVHPGYMQPFVAYSDLHLIHTRFVEKVILCEPVCIVSDASHSRAVSVIFSSSTVEKIPIALIFPARGF